MEYNRSFGLPERYQVATAPERHGMHLRARIPEVIRLSQDPQAKLQYFQTYFDFAGT